MPHLDALLPLYPDPAIRRALLEQALAQIHADLADMGQAIHADHHVDARQYVHRAKGTASFLGGSDSLPAFDQLTAALKTQHRPHIEPAFAAVEAALLELAAKLQVQLNKLPDTAVGQA
ncbi:hypothetical protein GG851_14930 [Bordetella petrii]|nr:hypothetical protein [Bordetella petrii]